MIKLILRNITLTIRYPTYKNGLKWAYYKKKEVRKNDDKSNSRKKKKTKNK